MKWISVKTKKPKCPRYPEALGPLVLIWPRDGYSNRAEGFSYYGRRATGYPTFYLYGAETAGVTHWQPMPGGPK